MSDKNTLWSANDHRVCTVLPPRLKKECPIYFLGPKPWRISPKLLESYGVSLVKVQDFRPENVVVFGLNEVVSGTGEVVLGDQVVH